LDWRLNEFDVDGRANELKTVTVLGYYYKLLKYQINFINELSQEVNTKRLLDLLNQSNDKYEKICLAIKESCDFTNIEENYEEVKGIETLKINLYSLENSGSEFYEQVKHSFDSLVDETKIDLLKLITENIDTFNQRRIISEKLEAESCDKDLELYAYLGILEETGQHQDFVNSVEVIVQQTNRSQLIGNRQNHLTLAEEVNQKQSKLDEGLERAKKNYNQKREEIRRKEELTRENKEKIGNLFKQLVSAYEGNFTDEDDCPKNYEEFDKKSELFSKYKDKLLEVSLRELIYIDRRFNEHIP
jgi:hypothetical protein